MPWLECKALDVCCGRRLRTALTKSPCCFGFLLLFVAGGLVLFIRLQDPSEMVHHQSPGFKLNGGKDLCTKEDQGESQGAPGGSVPPMQFPRLRSPGPGPTRVTKSHRKLLLKTSAGPTDEGQRLEWVQEARRRLVREVCAKYKGNGGKKLVTPQQVARIYVEDQYKLLYCEVPKAGCSNWKRVLMVLSGLASNPQEIQHDAVHYGNRLRRLDSFDRKGIAWRLETYTKMLFVREPFERLVSAFRDKFENPNTYYHPVFGRPIISRYRANASKVALRTGADVTFPEFVQYLLDVHRPVGMDIHWESASQLCSPCQLDYDFIGKFETMEEEANHLLRRIGAPSNLTLPTFKDRNPTADRTSARITEQYFAQLNISERQRAYDFYYRDYLMFNYSKPFKDLY